MFPMLAKLAQIYLTIPTSSAPVERILSIVGKASVLTDITLTDKKFKLCLKCNRSMILNFTFENKEFKKVYRINGILIVFKCFYYLP